MLLLFGGDVFIELVMELGEVQLQPNSSKQLFYYYHYQCRQGMKSYDMSVYRLNTESLLKCQVCLWLKLKSTFHSYVVIIMLSLHTQLQDMTQQQQKKSKVQLCQGISRPASFLPGKLTAHQVDSSLPAVNRFL